MDIRGVRPKSPFARAISEVVDAWAARTGAMYDATPAMQAQSGAAALRDQPAQWVKLLLAFDFDYRKRRLNFLIRAQNRLYQGAQSGAAPVAANLVDRLKGAFYACRDELWRRERSLVVDSSTRALVAEIFPAGPSLEEVRNLPSYAQAQVERHSNSIDRLIERLAAHVDLDATTRDIDRLLGASIGNGWPPEAAREVLVNYLGFPFFDVLTFPLMRWREVGEFDEVLVDRISAQDAVCFRALAPALPVRGVDFDHFAAFLSRSYRENDYLLGRLHALDRLIDIVCDSAGVESVRDLDRVGLKLRGFRRVLDAEQPHLPNSKALIAALRACVADPAPAYGARS